MTISIPDLAAQSRRLVRAVARENSPAGEQLCRLAAGDRKSWTLAEWRARLAELDSCNDTVGYWLTLHT